MLIGRPIWELHREWPRYALCRRWGGIAITEPDIAVLNQMLINAENLRCRYERTTNTDSSPSFGVESIFRSIELPA